MCSPTPTTGGSNVVEPRCCVVLGTQRGVGKSVVAGGLALVLRRQGANVGVFKPVSVGCRRTRHGLVSSDVEFLAHCADSPHDLATINPVRYRSGFVPAECARRSHKPVDFEAIQEAFHRVVQRSALTLVEGVGGLLEPLDEQTSLVDLAARWRAQVIVVAPSSAGAVNQVLMAVACLRQRGLEPASVLLNRYDAYSAPLADEVNPEQIATWARVSIPVMIPHDPTTAVPEGRVGQDTLAALSPLAMRLASRLR